MREGSREEGVQCDLRVRIVFKTVLWRVGSNMGVVANACRVE